MNENENENRTVTLVIEGGALEHVTPQPDDRVTQAVTASTGTEWEGDVVRIEREVPAPPVSTTSREALAEQLYRRRLEVSDLPVPEFSGLSDSYREEWAMVADYVLHLIDGPSVEQWVEWLRELPVGTVVKDADDDLARKTPDGVWESTFGTHLTNLSLTEWTLPLTLTEDQAFPW
jgi:hypothetical protein